MPYWYHHQRQDQDPSSSFDPHDWCRRVRFIFLVFSELWAISSSHITIIGTILQPVYSKLPPKAVATKPSASPVLEVAPLSPMGNFPMQNFRIGKFLMLQSSFRSGATSPSREFSFAEFSYRRISYAPVQF